MRARSTLDWSQSNNISCISLCSVVRMFRRNKY